MLVGDWGEIINAVDPNREIGFGFVSCSCRACVRAGEAKLRGRVRQGILNAGENPAEMFSAGGWLSLFIFAAIRMGYKAIFSRSMLYAWVLRNMLEIIELSMLFAWVLRFFRFFLGDINAICMGFKVILRSVCYTHWF